jgi:hypothetical protein
MAAGCPFPDERAVGRQKEKHIMRNQSLSRLLRIGLPLLVLAAALGLPTPAASCPSCFSESATAYSYCQHNPGGYYAGCNFQLQCGVGTSSANEIYREYCLL